MGRRAGESREAVVAREERALGLRARGWTHASIAAEVGLTRSGVTMLLARPHRRALRRVDERVLLLKQDQTEQLEHKHQELMDAWQRSKGASKSLTRRAGGRGGGPEVTTTSVEGQGGDVKYIAESRAVLADIRKIWGAD